MQLAKIQSSRLSLVYLDERCFLFPGSRQATLNLEHEVQGPGSPEHLIFLRRHLSHATVTEFLLTAAARVWDGCRCVDVDGCSGEEPGCLSVRSSTPMNA